jgi:hypothetical protein
VVVVPAAAIAVVAPKEWVGPQAVMWQLKFQHVLVVYTLFVREVEAHMDAVPAPTASLVTLHM